MAARRKHDPGQEASPEPDKKPLPRGLPANIDAERYVLGSILLNNNLFAEAQAVLKAEDFSLEPHRTIFRRMSDVYNAIQKVDRVTIANELNRHGELESCGGLSYLISLDDGMPTVPSIESYCKIVRDKSVLRRTILISRNAALRAMEQTDAPADIISSATRDLLALDMDSGTGSGAMTPIQIMESHPQGVSGFHQQAVEPGISTGFPQIDEAILGLQPQCQYVIGGGPGQGKSALAVCMAMAIAESGYPVGVTALEMSKEQILARMVCAKSEVSLKRFLRNELMGDERAKIVEASSRIADLPIYIDDTPSLSPTEMIARGARMALQRKIRVWVVDYLQLCDWQKQNNGGVRLDTEYAAITYTSRMCSLLARRFGMSNLIVSQLNRSNTRKGVDPRPKLSDLRGSGQIEQDATAVVFVFREEAFKPGRPELKGVAEAIVAKARMGEIGTKMLRFKGYCTKFIDEGEQYVPEDHD